MSIITERFPGCDWCHNIFPDYQMQPPLSPTKLRAAMARDGWFTIRRRDYCPECATTARLAHKAAEARP